MTQRDALNTKNYTLAHQKIDFYHRNFLGRTWGNKKFLQNRKIEFAKNSEYDLM